MIPHHTDPPALLQHLAHHELIPRLQRIVRETPPYKLRFTTPIVGDEPTRKAAETAAHTLVQTTAPDEVIRRSDRAYLLRRFLQPRDQQPQRAYLHHILYDDDEDPHDHPWPSLGWLISGTLIEQWWDSPSAVFAGPCTGSVCLTPGTAVLRPAHHIHRLVLPKGTPEAITLFVTEHKCREWGFWTPEFVPWQEYRPS